MGSSLKLTSDVLIVYNVPFPFGVWGRMWNSIVSVPDHCLFVYFSFRIMHGSKHDVKMTLSLALEAAFSKHTQIK